ncbi:peptidoglycan DD-metalloendopeptidase family protein [Reinekea marina]|uniref:peptidoglycan DD-metalloendopeptidase family protein n=1 Tax=Reinekea marina TaxID=1310421 RepID=UPI0025B4B796|nr:peptidoglycan DD-metalloendopeptidase family protein [Reinekea marina]MDN3650330.1 peptidoglycan DD-metalloendopeptidase family protein [Reinekea marina]MDN3651167.1 peptidoglycan DD-metalloendopeptidase family protein [Reinekea marina]
MFNAVQSAKNVRTASLFEDKKPVVLASKKLLVGILVVIIAGCVNHSRFTSIDHDKSVLSATGEPEIESTVYSNANPQFYLVKPGDTLYSIAFRFGLDYKKLANANNIDRNYAIYEGQALALKEASAPQITAKPAAKPVTKPASSSPSKSVTKVNSSSAKITKAVNELGSESPGQWKWPHNGNIVRTYKSGSSTQKGIDIRGSIGDSITAAASGVVVYAGNGLPGYGNLIIVEHSGSLLSAYAFAQQILVKESDKVSVGQQIAKMGKQGDQPGLHFEIRRNGKPVNPQSFLPKR